MAFNPIYLLLFIAVLSRVNGEEVINLEDREVQYEPNFFFGQSFGIDKWMFDSLITCHVTYPNGITYEAYPTDRLPAGPITFMYAARPFVSCLLGIKGLEADKSLDGRYTFQSLIQKHVDDSLSMTTQSFILSVIESED